MSCLRCHYEGPIMCTMTLNGTPFELCPECVCDLERFLRGRTLSDNGVIISRGFRKKEAKE